MKLKFFLISMSFLLPNIGCSDDTDEGTEEPITDPVYEKIYVSGANEIRSSMTVVNYLNKEESQHLSRMYYYSELFDHDQGGNYVLEYIDEENGSGMDSYPNITIGGSKTSGQWNPGDKELVGMPVKTNDLTETLSFEWTTRQENALDSDDKWMASINFIFDNYGTETSEPVASERDFDLVVMHDYQNFNDSLDDKPLTGSENDTRHWYFSRKPDESLKPYVLQIDGVSYTYAVRYKFFVNSGDKDNKTHVKFIPYENSQLPPVLKVNCKEIIQVAKDYVDYAAIPSEYLALAKSSIANENTWLKSINAGYEVYTGTSTLYIDSFKVVQ